MNNRRRQVLKAVSGGGAALAAQPFLSFPAIAQARTFGMFYLGADISALYWGRKACGVTVCGRLTAVRHHQFRC